MGVSYAQAAANKKRLLSKIKEREFYYACKLLSKPTSKTLTMGEYMLLEFMRLGYISHHQIDSIVKKFKELDEEGKGELSLMDLHKRDAIKIDKYSMKHLTDSLDVLPPELAVLANAASSDEDGKLEREYDSEPEIRTESIHICG